ncbi:DNA translocase FtsK [Vagococcus intermedius]|uniref:DNA translocase FtsK n=2 Tax=Vagococcus intermedius TaxID=2991418 RepID=A0AAF0CU03_9ENTE|nr:DNA translocase FtsK [Vagococcus intermedius]WEG75036.1 DNA translocase FtsK [Vagococcus intermedius]
MAKKKTSRSKKVTKKQQAQQERLLSAIIGAGLTLLGIFGLFKLGFLGVFLANIFRLFVGVTYPLLAILTIIYGLLLVFIGPDFSLKKPKIWIGSVIFYIGILIVVQAVNFRPYLGTDVSALTVIWDKLVLDIRNNVIFETVGGGLIGASLYSMSYFLVSQVGTYLISGLLLLLGSFLVLDVKWEHVQENSQTSFQSIKNLLSSQQARRAERRRLREIERAEEKLLAEEKRREKEAKVAEQKEYEKALAIASKPTELEEENLADLVAKEEPVAIDNYQANYQMPTEPIVTKAADYLAKGSITEGPTTQVEDPEELPLDFDIPVETENRDYLVPPSTLLNEIPLTDQSDEYKSIEVNVGILEQTFKSFGVDAKVVRASLGPSVTKYEIQPAVGVKVSKIVSLTDDLALALAAKDIRMEAPIPGKSLIGIEVPNNTVSMVSFRDIIEAQPKHEENLLEVPLGRDISGSVISADLAKMPHLLIAGSTGSGKSVCINGIIVSILMRAKPHEVKLMMIDPKMVELNVYNGIPHLLTPVVTNPRKAAQALHKVVSEMERRYELFASSGVRNITGYNEMIVKNNAKEGIETPVLPFIVVIVDELADLMMVASNEVEDAIIRLAQMARAAGIHMILATQRPSVDVITGIIKANVPSRIAFAVSSGTDSRTIIDGNGAEKLLGRGDMLFLPMGENKPIRVQGAFISDSEVEDIVSFVTEQQGADYQEDMMPTDEPEAPTVNGMELDELYNEAVEFIIREDKASVSMLQRKFRVGYNRAARMIDQLEETGVVGPSEGSKPRKVLRRYIPEEEVNNSALSSHPPLPPEPPEGNY